MSDFNPDGMPTFAESEARANGTGRDWRTVRTVLVTVVVPIAAIVVGLAWAVARLGGELS